MKFFTFVISIFIFSSCSSLKYSDPDKIIDHVLGDLKEKLDTSNHFVEKNVRSLNQLPKTSQSFFNLFEKELIKALDGELIYQKVKEYYKKNVPIESFIKVAKLFDRDIASELQAKERLDLNPENFHEFLGRLKRIDNWNKKVKIIESYDELAKISNSSIWMAQLITDGLINVYSRVVYNNQIYGLVKSSSRKNLNNFDLQTRYAASQSLRYTYQDFTLAELEQWQAILKNKHLQLILSQLKPALEHAYAQTTAMAKSKLESFVKK